MSTYKVNKLMSPMGIEYKKIHICPNNCILYPNEQVDDEKYPRREISCYQKEHLYMNKMAC